MAVIGELARTPRFQGAGSSQVNPTQVDVALDELTALLGDAPRDVRRRLRRSSDDVERRRSCSVRRWRWRPTPMSSCACSGCRLVRVGRVRPHPHRAARTTRRRAARRRDRAPTRTSSSCSSTARSVRHRRLGRQRAGDRRMLARRAGRGRSDRRCAHRRHRPGRPAGRDDPSSAERHPVDAQLPWRLAATCATARGSSSATAPTTGWGRRSRSRSATGSRTRRSS